MAITTWLASFQNSRIRPRSATEDATTDQVTIAVGAPNTLVRAANPNRTYITLRNENTGSGEDIRYMYEDSANILTDGFLLKAGEAIDLESKEAIYAQAISAPVNMSIDEGEG